MRELRGSSSGRPGSSSGRPLSVGLGAAEQSEDPARKAGLAQPAGADRQAARFSRPLGTGETLAYVVAGAGGYPNLHTLAKVGNAPPPVPWTDPVTGWTLFNYSQEHGHGFLRLTVTKHSIDGVYTTVPRP